MCNDLNMHNIENEHLYERIRELLGCKRNDSRWMRFLIHIAETPKMENNDSVFEDYGFTLHGNGDFALVAATLQVIQSDRIKPFVGRLPFAIDSFDRSADIPVKLGVGPIKRIARKVGEKRILEDVYFSDGIFLVVHFESDSGRLADVQISTDDPERCRGDSNSADRLSDALFVSIASWHNRAIMATSMNHHELARIALQKKWEYQVQLAKLRGIEPPPEPEDPDDITPGGAPPDPEWPPEWPPKDKSRVPKKPLPGAGSLEVALDEPNPED